MFHTESVQSGRSRHNNGTRVSWSYKRLFINQTSEHTTTRGTILCGIKCNRMFHSIGETSNILCYLQFAVVVLVYHISTFRQFRQLAQVNIQSKLGHQR